MVDFDKLLEKHYEQKYNELKKKIKDWHDKIEKATWNVSTHLFREVLEVVKEMEKEIE